MTKRWKVLLFLLLIIVLLPQKSQAEVRITAVGDINFGGRLKYIAKNKGFSYFFSFTDNLFLQDDLSLGNLECVLSKKGSPVSKKKYTFRGDPEAALALKKWGFELISVANNHSKDFGETAFLDSLEHLKKAGLFFAGGGRNLSEARSPVFLQIGKRKIGFLAYSRVLPPGWSANSKRSGVAPFTDFHQVLQDIKRAKRNCDFLIVSVHWGKEMSPNPSSRQIKQAHQMIETGTDFLMGHHPHVVQGFEIYHGKLIAYSLGNFIFSPGSSKGNYSAILQFTLDEWGVKEAKIYPVFISNGQPRIIKSKNRWLEEIKKRCNRLSNKWELAGDELVFRSFRSKSFQVFLHLLKIKEPYLTRLN